MQLCGSESNLSNRNLKRLQVALHITCRKALITHRYHTAVQTDYQLTIYLLQLAAEAISQYQTQPPYKPFRPLKRTVAPRLSLLVTSFGLTASSLSLDDNFTLPPELELCLKRILSCSAAINRKTVRAVDTDSGSTIFRNNIVCDRGQGIQLYHGNKWPPNRASTTSSLASSIQVICTFDNDTVLARNTSTATSSRSSSESSICPKSFVSPAMAQTCMLSSRPSFTSFRRWIVSARSCGLRTYP